MFVPLLIIVQCLHACVLGDQVHSNTTISNEFNSSSNAVRIGLDNSLGYSKSHVLQQGTTLSKVSHKSSNKQTILNSDEEINSTLLDRQKKDGNTKWVLATDLNKPLGYDNAHVLSKIPLNILTLSSKLIKEYSSKPTRIFEHINNGSTTVKQTEGADNDRSLTGQNLQKSSPYNYPASSYATASSWAGSYGKPSTGGVTANAQASASAGDSSASAFSGSSTGTGHYGAYQGGGTSGHTAYQGVQTSPTSAGSGGYYGQFNKPTGMYSGSTSYAGSGGSSYNKPATFSSGNYNPYNRPVTSSTSGNYYKPSPNSGTTSTSSSGYGTQYKPALLITSGNNQNINNKPISESTTRPTGAYYNGYFISTSPNHGSSLENTSNNRPSSDGLRPSTGSAISPNNLVGNTPGSSSVIIPLPITNSGVSQTSMTPGSNTAISHAPWWLQTGVFSSTSIMGSLQGISGMSSTSTQAVNNLGLVTPTGVGTGGFESFSTSGAGNQGGGSSSGSTSNFNAGAGLPMASGTGGLTSVLGPETGIQGGGPSPGITSQAGSSSNPLVGSSEVHGSGMSTGSFVESTSGFQTNEGSGSLIGAINNNNVGFIYTQNTNQLNSSSTGPSQTSHTSTIETLGSMKPVINPVIPSQVATITDFINSGISMSLPWWFVTGIFSASVDRPGTVDTSVLLGLANSGSSNGSIINPGWPGVGNRPGNHLASLPSGENIDLHHSQSLQSSTESPIGVGSNIRPTSSTDTHKENLTSGNLHGGLPQETTQTGGLATSSQTGIPPQDGYHSTLGLAVDQNKPGNRPTTLEANQVNSFISSLQPGIPPFNSVLSGSGELANSQQAHVQNLPSINSALATTTSTADTNSAINSQVGPSQLVDTIQQGSLIENKMPVSPQPVIYPDIIFPTNSQTWLPSVSDVAISSRPPGWSAGQNGPAAIIGFQSKPNSGSVVTLSSIGSNTNTNRFPYKTSEENTSDMKMMSVLQHPSALVEDGKPTVSELSVKHSTEDKLPSTAKNDKETAHVNESKDITQDISSIH